MAGSYFGQCTKGAENFMKRWMEILAVVLWLLGSADFGSHEAEAAVLVGASAPEIQYFGRWEHSHPAAARTGRGAAYLRVDFTGSSLGVRLKDDKNWWRYSIDGREYTKFRPQAVETMLAENLAPGRHQLFLARCTEGQGGISEFSGLLLADDGSLQSPTAVHERRIEVIGDSIAAGAMNDGPLGLSYYTIEDGLSAFGPVLAQKLRAEWSIVAKSGEGVVHNYTENWSGQGKGKNLHVQDTYVRTFFSQAEPQWNPAQFSPQLILIAMGTNDFVERPRKPAESVFTAGYGRLLQLVRQMNPEAVILGIEPVPLHWGPEPGRWIANAVAKQRLTGDSRVYFVPIHGTALQLLSTDFIGDDTHPTIEGSKKLAAYLYGEVERIMGWHNVWD